MWRFRVKRLRGGMLRREGASLRLSLERLERSNEDEALPGDLPTADEGFEEIFEPSEEVPPPSALVRMEVPAAPPEPEDEPPEVEVESPHTDILPSVDGPLPAIEPLPEVKPPPEVEPSPEVKSPPAAPEPPTDLPSETEPPPKASGDRPRGGFFDVDEPEEDEEHHDEESTQDEAVDTPRLDPGAAPPALTVREHMAQPPPGRPIGGERRPLPSRWALFLALLLGALLSALITRWYLDRSPEERPPRHVQELARHIAQGELAEEQTTLDQRRQLLDTEEERVLTDLRKLLDSHEQLARQHSVSLERAQRLQTNLRNFLDRTGQNAGDNTAAEVRGYIQALDGLIELISSEERTVREQARDLEIHLDRRNLIGRKVRVIHDPTRAEDAQTLAERLRGYGLEAEAFPAEVADPEIHRGRLYYSGDDERLTAEQLARLVEDIEPVVPESIGVATDYLALWVVGETFSLLEELDPEPAEDP